MEKAQALQRESANSQLSIFASLNNNGRSDEMDHIQYPDMAELGKQEKLSFEKECLGFYISGHPLDNVMDTLKRVTTMNTTEAHAAEDEIEVVMGGVVQTLKEIKTKKGDIMAFVTLEDLSGSIELTIFSDLYRGAAGLLKSEKPLLIKGKLAIEGETKRNIIVNEIIPLEQAGDKLRPDIHVKCLINRIGIGADQKARPPIRIGLNPRGRSDGSTRHLHHILRSRSLPKPVTLHRINGP